MSKFKVGDRVKNVGFDDFKAHGLTGTIMGVSSYNTSHYIVKFDAPYLSGHRGQGGNSTYGYVSDKYDCLYISQYYLELVAENAEIDNTPKIKLDKEEETKEMGTGILKRFVGFFADEDLVKAAKLADEIAEQGYHKAKLLVVKDGFSFNYGFKKNTLKRVTIRRAQKMVTL